MKKIINQAMAAHQEGRLKDEYVIFMKRSSVRV